MDFIDIVFAVILGFAAFRGIKNGLFVEIASLVSFFIGIYIAVKFSYIVGGFIGDSKTAKVAAFVITLIAVVIGIHSLAKVFSKIASWVFLGWLNKLGGAVFAVLKTVLLLGIVLSLFQKVNVDNALISKETQEKSIFYTPVLKTSELLLPVLTEWFSDLKNSVDEDNSKLS
ncbi:MAG: CvpA family protein [Flavobacteriales bacterium]|nr:CvpA family protein [Flavobacteriales bacterium]